MEHLSALAARGEWPPPQPKELDTIDGQSPPKRSAPNSS
jgi:hypothetical protein